MFLPDWPTRRRGRTMIVSASLHVAALTALLIGPMWAVSEPVEPDLKICWCLPPIPAQLVQVVTPPPRVRPPTTTSPLSPGRHPAEVIAPPSPPSPPTIVDVPTDPHVSPPTDIGSQTSVDSKPVKPSVTEEKPVIGIIDPDKQYLPNLTPPVAVSTPDPIYPEAARRAHLEGVVVLQAVIGTDGRVADVRVTVSANPLLDQAAVAAVRRWTYVPAHLDDRDVSVYLTVTLTFKLHA